MWIIIQARTKSKRFPNKIMADLGGEPVIKHVVDLCKRATDKVIVAIPCDDPVKEYLINEHILYREGSGDDVLSRYYHTALAVGAKQIVRITADCPLLNVSTLYTMMRTFGDADFMTNLPCVDGWDVEIMSMSLLKYLYSFSTDREHVTDYVKKHPERLANDGFKCIKYADPYLTEWFPKMSVDTKEDLAQIRSIYEKIMGQAS